jgi:uncharacterized protein DUF3489
MPGFGGGTATAVTPERRTEMIKLNHTQLLILSKASQRADRGADIPTGLKGKTAVTELLAGGLLEELPANDALPVWRKTTNNRPMALRITAKGQKAVRIEEDTGSEGPSAANTKMQRVKPTGKTTAAANQKRASTKTSPSRSRAANAGKSTNAGSVVKELPMVPKPPKTSVAKPKGKSGRIDPPISKKDAVLAILRRPKGATISNLMKATGWQAHTVRGFFAGTVRKRLALNLVSNRSDGERTYRVTNGKHSRKT